MTAADPLPPDEAARVAARALPLLDLTDLSEACTAEAVRLLCDRAKRHAVAAVCVWPRFVTQAAQSLAGSGVRIATVVNFPEGGEEVGRTVGETRATLLDGADEIDLVLPYRALLRGDADTPRAMVAAVREACGDTLLKVILETGMLPDAETVARASRLALDAGADFLKTSTGKTPVSATPEAAGAMLSVIRQWDGARPIGLKVSGGLRRIEDAARYLALADGIMGPDWAMPKTFRIGASALLDDLTRAVKAAA